MTETAPKLKPKRDPAIFEEARRKAAARARPPRRKMTELISTLDKLQTEEFEDLRWIIEDILPEGCTVLGGKPKIGKTWLAQDMGLSVATGRPFMGKKCEQGDELYLALEDNRRRFKRRMKRFYGPDELKWPTRFTFATEWPTLDDECIQYIVEWIKSVEKPVLIIVDILENVKPINDRRNSKDPQYRVDYNAVAPFRILADEHQLAVLLLHHQRKMAADDLMDTLSGTLGLGGGIDNAIILGMDRDGSGGRYLWGKGRDLDEFNFSVKQDENMRFVNLGTHELDSAAMTARRKQIILILTAAGQPVPIHEVALRTGTSPEAAKMALQRMFDAELIARPAPGQYALLQIKMPLEGGSGEKPPKPKKPKPGHNARKII